MSEGVSNGLAGLLASVEALLRDKVVPDAAGEARFAGLMAASAVGMARREIGLQRSLDSATADVAEIAPQPSPYPDPITAVTCLLREGLLDADDEVYRRLMTLAATRTAVTRPKMLTPNERSMAGLG